MKEDIRMASHKLMLHPEVVAKWLKGRNIYPISVELSPSGGCNHRCIFCALDYRGYKPSFIDKDLILSNLNQMIQNGLKSVVLCGEGEPLLNKNTPEIINSIKNSGADVALSTNGVLFNYETAKNCLKQLTWIRFSLNAGTESTHQKIHRGKQGDFDKIVCNIENAVKTKKEVGAQTTIGVQMLLIPENYSEVYNLAKILKDLKVDYFSVKPFSKHSMCSYNMDKDFDYYNFLDMEQQLKELENEKFSIIFRSESMKRRQAQKTYNECLGIYFWIFIDSNAEVWTCSAYIGNKDFSYGNLKEKSFTEIWEGQDKQRVFNNIKNIDLDKCRELCRLDSINAYLNEVKCPGKHANFI